MKPNESAFVCQTMRIDIRNLVPVSIVCLLALACYLVAEVSADKKILLVKERIVNSSDPIDSPNYPLVHMSKILASDHKNNRFRLKWFYSMGSFQRSGEAVYSRARKTLTEISNDLDGGLGMAWSHHVLYQGVTDAMLTQASQELGDQGDGPFSFDFLPKYGAVSTQLK